MTNIKEYRCRRCRRHGFIDVSVSAPLAVCPACLARALVYEDQAEWASKVPPHFTLTQWLSLRDLVNHHIAPTKTTAAALVRRSLIRPDRFGGYRPTRYGRRIASAASHGMAAILVENRE